MSINLKVHDDGYHTCLVWLPADGQPIAGCRGFTVRRLFNGTESYLHGFVGFSDDDRLEPAASWKFPLQRLLYEAANVMLTRYQKPLKLKDWPLAIGKRSTMRKARIALARRLAIIMHAMLRHGTEFKAA